MNTKLYKRTSLAMAMSLCLLGSALAAPNALQAELSRFLKAMPDARVNSESRQAMRQALVLVGQDRLDEGSQQLNAALELDPSNSYLQQAREFITAGHPHRSEALNVRGATPRTERA